MVSERARAGGFSAGSMARLHPLALLQLSRDGRARDDFHWGDGAGSAAAVAREIVRVALDVVGLDAVRAAAIHREHRGMDDRGTRATTVADLRIDEDGRWSFAASRRRKCVVHADRIHGHVFGAGNPLALFGVARD